MPRRATRSSDPLSTHAERSGWRESGPASEVDALLRAFARRFPGRVRATRFGTSPEGRPLWVVAASADGVLTPEKARKRRRPVVFALAGIHPGEIDGKDAGFLLLRGLLEGTTLPGVLRDVTFVLVPIFNVDGHENRGPHHRPNQNGPAETGWRATARNLNLNRDWTKADAPEMRALLPVLRAWDPVAFVDLHVTDGAHFESAVSVLVAPLLEGPPELRALAAPLHDTLMEDLGRGGHHPVDFYPSLVEDDRPEQGFTRTVYPARFSHSYWGQRGRLAVLVETHSWKDYGTRVRTTHDVLVSVLGTVRSHGSAWRRRMDALDRATARTPPGRLELAWEATDETESIDFPAYAYERVPSPATGGTYLRYRLDVKETWRVPLRHRVAPTVTVDVPRGGWAVPPGWSDPVAEALERHGIAFRRLRAARTVDTSVFRVTRTTPAPAPFEGRTRMSVAGTWVEERRTLAPGTLLVPSAQALCRLAAQLLEPEGPDSLLAWGTFNAAFQAQEYIEAYLVEPWAEARLAEDGALRAEFEARLRDPAFAQDAAARRAFFTERHPSFDRRIREVPVVRLLRPVPRG